MVTKEVTAYSAIIDAGWSMQEAPTALAIAMAESGLNPTATHKNTNGSTDYGLFQVNSIHNPTQAEKTEPVANAKKAYSIYAAAGNKWTPWATFNSGAYKSHLAAANAVITGTGKQIQENVDKGMDIQPGPLNPLDGISQTLSKFGSSVLGFVNVSLGLLLGIVLVVLGVVILARGMASKVVTGVAKDALKGATATKAVTPRAVPKPAATVQERAAKSLEYSRVRKQLQAAQLETARQASLAKLRKV